MLEAIRHPRRSRGPRSHDARDLHADGPLALRSLLDAGLVREARPAEGGPSYGAVYFEPVPEAALVLGFDLGVRFLRGGLADLRATSVPARTSRSKASTSMPSWPPCTPGRIAAARAAARPSTSTARSPASRASSPPTRRSWGWRATSPVSASGRSPRARHAARPARVARERCEPGGAWRAGTWHCTRCRRVRVRLGGTGLGAGLVLGGQLPRGRDERR